MPALPADIALVLRAQQIETASNAAIKARYPSARDGSDQPAQGYFDVVADADTVLAARAALIGVERRRFSVTAADLLWLDPSIGLPTVTLIDPENNVAALAMLCRLEADLDAERTALELLV